MGAPIEEPLCTPQCSRRLKELSQRSVGLGGTGGWAKYFSGPPVDSGTPINSGVSEQRAKKRKGSLVILDSDGEETGQQRKRIKTDDCGESLDAAEQSIKEQIPGRVESDAPAETPDYGLQPAPHSSCDPLPEHIKVRQNSPVLYSLTSIICFHNISS